MGFFSSLCKRVRSAFVFHDKNWFSSFLRMKDTNKERHFFNVDLKIVQIVDIRHTLKLKLLLEQ